MGNIKVQKGDITRIEVDAIVNAANKKLAGGGGVDGAIHRAGGSDIMDELDEIREKQGECPTGEAVITTAGDLPADYVIHAVGPVWNGGEKGEPQLLKNAYLNSLNLAREKKAQKVSFPNISTGVYGYPKQDAAEIAVGAVKGFLEENDMPEEVIFVCFDDESYNIYQELLA